jgi:GNAT superfamily N-acetyltransferase
MDISLRPATPADAEEVAGVYVTSWNQAFADVAPLRVLDRDQVLRWGQDLAAGGTLWWLAEDEVGVVGFAGTGPSRDPVDPELGELDTIAVQPRAWRHGVGRALMDAAVNDLVGAGYDQAVLWTFARGAQARRFYEATGWRASGETRDSGSQMAFRRLLVPGGAAGPTASPF